MRRFRPSLLVPLLLLAALLTALPAFAASTPAPGGKPGGAPGAGPGGGEDKDKPYQEWKKVTKDAEVKKGFFNLYLKRENLYMEITPAQLDKPVLGIFSLARGIGQNGVIGGLPVNDRLLEFHRAGDHVLVYDENTRFTAPEGSPTAKAIDLSMTNSVIASLKIESIQDSTKSLLVDLAPFLVSDMPDIAEWMRGSFNGKSMRFDKERSALSTIKNFPENTEIEATLTYSPNDRTNYGLATVPDDRYVSVAMHYSFSKLPDKPMMPRLADDRTGYFLTVMKDFSRDTKEHFFVRYVNRWRLEKKDPTAAVSEPVKPIVYYIDRTVPEKYRGYIKQGIERWQKSFEAAGFKNAIIAKDAPDDPNWDPEDVRYSTIRWITSSPPVFGAIGPSRVDPRTGEILDADILIEASIVQRRWRIYQNLMGTPVATDIHLDANGMPVTEGSPSRAWPGADGQQYQCDLAAGLAGGAALAQVAFAMQAGDASQNEALWEKYTAEMMVHTVLHEVGHTLGLRHNFRSSMATPLDKLNDRSWTTAHGLVASVMDYATPNIDYTGTHQGQFYGDYTGTADDWMIRYGYTPSGAADVNADYAFAAKIADESEQPGHEYSTDEDTNGPFALDPRTNHFDLSGDPLEFARERAAYISTLWKSPKLEDRVLLAGGEYPVLRRAVDGLFEQYGIALGLAVKWVGGQYNSRSHKGQPGAVPAMMPVPAAKQREALDFIAARAFATNAFAIDPGLLVKLGPDRWSHWGIAETFGQYTGPRLDYNFNDKAFAIQNGLLDQLTAPMMLARVREAESHVADPYKLSEHFDRLTRSIWGEVGGGPTAAPALKALEGPSTRRDLQRAYVDKLAGMLVSPANGLPDDARALARLQLSRIDSRAARTLALAATQPIGDYTRAHLMETRARIKRALEAGREADAAPAPRGPGGFATP